MAFTRTSSGLKNLHLFYNVDLIVYTEGGTSLSVEDVKARKFNSESIDSVFWNIIFSNYKSESIKYKPIGSKATVSKIAKEIIQNNIKTVYAVMDQEFDMVYETNFSHSNIVYTYGYSWENDVWNKNAIFSIIETLSAKNVDKTLISNLYDEFINKIKYFVGLDGHLFSKSDSYFPRPKGHMKLVNCDPKNEPFLKTIELTKIIEEKEIDEVIVNDFLIEKNICAIRNCYGHLLGDFCKQLIHHILKIKYNLSGIKDEFIKRMAINLFFKYANSETINHYSNSINN
jgi:hypothetical protein